MTQRYVMVLALVPVPEGDKGSLDMYPEHLGMFLTSGEIVSTVVDLTGAHWPDTFAVEDKALTLSRELLESLVGMPPEAPTNTKETP